MRFAGAGLQCSIEALVRFAGATNKPENRKNFAPTKQLFLHVNRVTLLKDGERDEVWLFRARRD